MLWYCCSKIKASIQLSLLLYVASMMSASAQTVNEIQMLAPTSSQPAEVLDFNQSYEHNNNLFASNSIQGLDDSMATSRTSSIVPLPLLAEEPDPMYEHKVQNLGLTPKSDFPDGVYPFNFGQFLIGQLTLAEYNNIWKTVREENILQDRCRLHYRGDTFIATGLNCFSYFNYVEAHADKKGMLASIAVSGNQPDSHTTEEMLSFLSKRYSQLYLERMPEQLRYLSELRQDLCRDMTRLMNGSYKCEDHWFYFRNFYLVFSPSVYLNHRKEQFIYGTLHHFVEYETKMVKRRLAIVRQELNAKLQSQESTLSSNKSVKLK